MSHSFSLSPHSPQKKHSNTEILITGGLNVMFLIYVLIHPVFLVILLFNNHSFVHRTCTLSITNKKKKTDVNQTKALVWHYKCYITSKSWIVEPLIIWIDGSKKITKITPSYSDDLTSGFWNGTLGFRFCIQENSKIHVF